MAEDSRVGGHAVLTGLCCTAAGTLGLLPLGQKIFGARQRGLYGYVTGLLHANLHGILTYLVPIIVVVFFLGLVIVIDRMKKRA